MNEFKFNLERQEVPKPATIRLEIFRHDDKGSNTNADPDDSVDRVIPLSAGGRSHSRLVGQEKNPQPEVGLVYGSSRDRTIESAERQLFSQEEAISDDLSLAEMNALIEGSLAKGKKYRSSPLLDFDFSGSEKFREIKDEHFRDKKDLLVWYLEDSDALVEAERDLISTSYSRLAANVAELVTKYVSAYSRWQKIVESNPDKYVKFNNELQRFMGTHQGVGEAFLMKAIEKTQGKEAVYSFIDSLASKNGFAFGEGYSVVIGEEKLENGENSKSVIINQADRRLVLTEEVLADIIADRDYLDKLTKI